MWRDSCFSYVWEMDFRNILPYLGETKVSTVKSDLTTISILKRFIYRRVNTSKILHGATIPVALTKN